MDGAELAELGVVLVFLGLYFGELFFYFVGNLLLFGFLFCYLGFFGFGIFDFRELFFVVNEIEDEIVDGFFFYNFGFEIFNIF